MNIRKPRTFGTPVDLFQAFVDYTEWVDNNPWLKNEAIKSGSDCGKIIQVPTQRPYTLTGFAVFCKVHSQTIRNYGDIEMYPEYFEVYGIMNDAFTAQKFEGAAVGAFNANIIARDLGLKDSSEVDTVHSFKQIPTIKKDGKEVEFDLGSGE